MNENFSICLEFTDVESSVWEVIKSIINSAMTYSFISQAEIKAVPGMVYC